MGPLGPLDTPRLGRLGLVYGLVLLVFAVLGIILLLLLLLLLLAAAPQESRVGEEAGEGAIDGTGLSLIWAAS